MVVPHSRGVWPAAIAGRDICMGGADRMGVRMGPSGEKRNPQEVVEPAAEVPRPWLRRIDLVILPVVFVLDILLFSSLLRADVLTAAGRVAIVAYSAAGVAVLVLRRLAPVPVFAVIWVHSVLALLITDRYVPVVLLLVALEAVAELKSLKVSLICLATMLVPTALLVTAAIGAASEQAQLTAGVGSALFYVSVDVLAWGIGRWARRHHRQVDTLRVEHTLEVQEQRALTENAVSAERLRIARELHDIVAHSVTIMVLHAAGAKRVVDTDPDRAKESLTTIEESGQQAMGELRRLLELLREDESDLLRSGSPLPGLAQLSTTIQSVRGSGVAVTLEVSGTPRRLDTSTDLAAYRLVQEGLTNVTKHRGAGAHATVSIEWGTEKLTVAVEDDGQGSSDLAPELSTGSGLAGLRERIAVAGGDIVAGPTGAGGFRVAARLPLSALTGGAAHGGIPTQSTGGVASTGGSSPADPANPADPTAVATRLARADP